MGNKGKMKHKNNTFSQCWFEVRKAGKKRCILSKIRNLSIMMALIYVINILLSRELNYILMAGVYLVLTVVMPFASWEINERRYHGDEIGERDRL